MPFFLMLLGGAKSAGGAVLSWLSKRSLAELACIALAVICAVQFLQVRAERRHSAKVSEQLRKCAEVQKKLEAESKERQNQVTRTITKYKTVTLPDAERKAREIENAPVVPGKCETPSAVLQADI